MCSVAKGRCTTDGHSMSWNALAGRNVDKLSSNDVPCPGGESCPDGDTCCPVQSGEYGCCPYPKVVITSQ